ncbi:hypothetical protein DFQ00_11542 [Paenibacillus barcinonensis]|uniref:Uncharacterized protein n=1 Tax=Paenibacillus barcinonensis TaxID=198119 RepID=A0A2V4V4B4_PAEBA|nr:hypothetical protein DFQ00_11542 [Paenibacillus barcinonensis]
MEKGYLLLGYAAGGSLVSVGCRFTGSKSSYVFVVSYLSHKISGENIFAICLIFYSIICKLFRF